MAEFSQHERRGLRRMQAGAEPHPDADLLTAYAEQTLTVREREQVLTHLAVCSPCREVAALASPLPIELPELRPAPQQTFWRWPVLRWGAVAASAVIVVAAVSLGVRERGNKPEQFAAMRSETATAPPAKSADTYVNGQQPAQKQEATDELKPAEGTSGMKRAKVRYEKETSAPQKKFDKDQVAEDRVVTRSEASGGARRAVGGIGLMNATPVGPTVRSDKTSTDLGFAQENAYAGKSGKDGKVAAAAPAATNAKPVPPPPPPPPAEVVMAKKAAPGTATETVEVQSGAQAGNVQSSQSLAQLDDSSADTAGSHPNAKEKAQIQSEQSDMQPNPAFYRTPLARRSALMAEWQISSQGILQRSLDQGKSWQPALSDNGFRAIAVIRNQVWAGGANGLLMHSADNGQTWSRVTPQVKDAALQGDIVSIQFDDMMNGLVKTSTGQTWSTSDGGKNWTKQ